MASGMRAPIPSHKFSKEILSNNILNFSDSIIFYIECSTDEKENIIKFESLCWLSNEFIAKSILTTNDSNRSQIALRCGIAYGEAIIKKDISIIIGQPFIDAYDLSNCQQWMGGAIHQSVPIDFCEKITGYGSELFKHPVPFEISKEKNMARINKDFSLNWVKHHPSLPNFIHDLKRIGPTLFDIGGHISHYPWENKDDYLKGRNTIDFVKKIDEAWNKAYNVENGTIRQFQYPDWYHS
jgi:hypothetical protein